MIRRLTSKLFGMEENMKKRILILALIAMMVFLPLVGCTGGNGGEVQTQPPQGEDPTVTEDLYDSKGYLKDSLPSDLNYDADIKVLHWTESDILEFDPDEETPYATEKAIWERTEEMIVPPAYKWYQRALPYMK